MSKRTIDEMEMSSMQQENDGFFIKMNSLNITISECFCDHVKDELKNIHFSDRRRFINCTLFDIDEDPEEYFDISTYKEFLYVQLKYYPNRTFGEFILDIKRKAHEQFNSDLFFSEIQKQFISGMTMYPYEMLMYLCSQEELCTYGF